MALELRPFDPADYLDTDKARAAYMTEAFESNDPAFIADALGAIARSHGTSNVARDTGLSRENLYRALSAEGNPELSTLLRIMQAHGMRLAAKPADPEHAHAQ